MIWRLRSIAFNIVFYTLTLALGIACIPLMLAPRNWQRQLPPVWLALLYFCERHILGLDYRVIGAENLPPPPYIAAMKHQSAWETMKLYRLFGNPAIILKKELMQIPLWGQYAKAMDMVPVDRSQGRLAMKSMVESAKQILVDKRPLVVFPQGTRIAVGKKAPYKSGVMKLYEALDVPLVPVALNAGLFWPRQAFWKRPGVITVQIFPPIPPGQDPKEVFHRLQKTVEEASDRLARDAVRDQHLETVFPHLSTETAE
jgi:1-acyl-sn-glycerol-3-phosphate acyltransferase